MKEFKTYFYDYTSFLSSRSLIWIVYYYCIVLYCYSTFQELPEEPLAVGVASEVTEETNLATVQKLKPAKVEKSRPAKKLPKVFPKVEQIIEGSLNDFIFEQADLIFIWLDLFWTETIQK